MLHVNFFFFLHLLFFTLPLEAHMLIFRKQNNNSNNNKYTRLLLAVTASFGINNECDVKRVKNKTTNEWNDSRKKNKKKRFAFAWMGWMLWRWVRDPTTNHKKNQRKKRVSCFVDGVEYSCFESKSKRNETWNHPECARSPMIPFF